MYTFDDEELKELQLKELEMFKVFKAFCEKHGLLFYFCGGCCIGALRHKGFIPWDDDIDVFMPREDYEKLLPLWEKYGDNERYKILRSSKEFFSGSIFTNIVDTQTTWIKPEFQDRDLPFGVPMDIFPLDGCPKGKWARKIQMLNALLYSLYCVELVPQNHGPLVTLIGKVLLGIVPKRFYYRIWKSCERRMSKYPFEKCEYITELCAGPHYMKNKYPKRAFESAVYKEFEGIEAPLPVGFDEYLKIAFGDYMQLPPKEKQVAHHDVLFADLNNSYTKYKGIYYCKKEKDK